MEYCAAKHVRCNVLELKSVFIPNRVLDVGPGDNLDRVLLIDDTASLFRNLPRLTRRYVALSCCWGTSVPLKTTTASLARHREGIQISSMPQVFREAVFVVRKLRLRYLWIDALCIIQDSTADWEQESVRMSDIFAHSYITIYAAASTACDQGFLHRTIGPVVTIPFRSCLNPGVSGEYSIFLEGQHVCEEDIDCMNTRWNSRAWVWQEQVMAPRLVVFGPKMLQMRCRQAVKLEDGYFSSLWRRPDGFFSNDYFWFSGISEFSKKEITYVRDRLSAVSGVARYISRALEERGCSVKYLAGLWLNDTFPQQLCWVIPEPRQSYKEMMTGLMNEESYCAPSWSWASRNRGVAIRDPLAAKTAFQVVRYDLPPAGLDATVAVRPGSSITLCGKLGVSPLVSPNGSFTQTHQVQYRYRHNIRRKGSSGRIIQHLDWVPNTKDAEEKDAMEHIQFFFACQRHWSRVSGLILLPLEGAEGTLYRQVGFFSSKGDYSWLRVHPEVDVTII